MEKKEAKEIMENLLANDKELGNRNYATYEDYILQITQICTKEESSRVKDEFRKPHKRKNGWWKSFIQVIIQ